MKEFSIVVPIYNEEAVLPELERRLLTLLKHSDSFEVILVDDGSTDASRSIIQEICKRDIKVRFVFLSRNFGHQAAVSAGLCAARGQYVGVIDADLQDSPDVLLEMYRKAKSGFDVVYGVRQNRKEGVLKKTAYFVFYRFLSFLTQKNKIPLDAGDFSVMSRRVVDVINNLPERNRFVRGLRSWVGFTQVGFPYEREKRFAGETKYSVRKLFKLAYDGIFSFSYIPLSFISAVGFVVSTVSFVGIVVVLYFKIFTNASIPGFASTATITLFLGGIQMLSLGVIGEYIKRMYEEVKNRPNFIIESESK